MALKLIVFELTADRQTDGEIKDTALLPAPTIDVVGHRSK